jgi:hypothetical protein
MPEMREKRSVRSFIIILSPRIPILLVPPSASPVITLVFDAGYLVLVAVIDLEHR